MIITSKHTIHEGKYLSFKTIVTDKEKVWEYCERVNTPDIVVIRPICRLTKHLVLCKQYRPILERYCLEFPAGIVDKGETVKEAAERELLEETGYQSLEMKVYGPFPSSGGLTTETFYICDCICSQDKVEQKLEKTEDIEVVYFDTSTTQPDLYYAVVEYCKLNNILLDSKVFQYLKGVHS